MLTKTIVVLALVCGLFPAATAADQELEKLLIDQYRDKVLALRHPFKSSSQEYDAEGKPAKRGEEGPWTLYGRIVVKKIAVDAGRLKVEGQRAVYGFNKNGSLVRFSNDRKHPAEELKVTLRLNQPLASADEAATVLGRVFARTPEEMVSSVPTYWQPQVAKLLGVGIPKKTDLQDASGTGVAAEAGSDQIAKLADFTDRKHFTAPRVLYKREPNFSEAARAWRYEGTVGMNVIVDNTGRVGQITIVHPLGMGLDENAVETVRNWRFAPATHDGQPIAVLVYIEIDYHLY